MEGIDPAFNEQVNRLLETEHTSAAITAKIALESAKAPGAPQAPHYYQLLLHGPVRLFHGPVPVIHGPVSLVHGTVRLVHGPVRLIPGPVALVHGPVRHVQGALCSFRPRIGPGSTFACSGVHF